MHGTRLYEAEKERKLREWEIHSKKLSKEKEKKESTTYYANCTEISTIAYGKKPQYRQKVKKR